MPARPPGLCACKCRPAMAACRTLRPPPSPYTPALPLPRLALSAEAQWVREQDMPLWLVKQYEEEQRGAQQQQQQDAQQAASTAPPVVPAPPPAEGQEGPAPCAACGLADGAGTAEQEALWVTCGRCAKWYHGACENLGQGAAEALAAEDATYVCRRVHARPRHTHARTDTAQRSAVRPPARVAPSAV